VFYRYKSITLKNLYILNIIVLLFFIHYILDPLTLHPNLNITTFVESIKNVTGLGWQKNVHDIISKRILGYKYFEPTPSVCK